MPPLHFRRSIVFAPARKVTRSSVGITPRKLIGQVWTFVTSAVPAWLAVKERGTGPTAPQVGKMPGTMPPGTGGGVETLVRRGAAAALAAGMRQSAAVRIAAHPRGEVDMPPIVPDVRRLPVNPIRATTGWTELCVAETHFPAWPSRASGPRSPRSARVNHLE